jgi:xanthine dehydrogenase accessory factor
MNNELEIWRFAAERLKQNESVMLLTVAESAGSSPGRPGFKMIVAEHELAGSIGGGVMEVRLVELAKVKSKKVKGKNKSEIRNPKSQIVRQTHRKNAPDASGMICSGSQTVIFYKLDSDDLPVIDQIISALENQRPGRLTISDSKFQISDSAETRNDDFYFRRTGADEFVYEENLGFKNRLFIVGGGHCALALSELMSKLDFHITLFDDRAELNTLAKNEFADEKKILESYMQIDDFIPSGADVYTVVMTLGYKFDELVIRRLFDKDFKYFGVLGSKAKMKTLLKALEKEGFDKTRLNRIRTPVGLPINSRTPQEIAVSIAAEIIAVKNARSAKAKVVK